MQFTKKLRPRIKSGDITTSIRIWTSPHVKVGGAYTMEEGRIVVTSIREISFDDITETLAKDSGFLSVFDLMKTAKHGAGRIIYFVKFHYQD